MPDFTTITTYQCKQLESTIYTVGDYVVRNPHQENVSCTCGHFVYRKQRCKHIKKVESERCTWHEQFGESMEEEGVCPRCGGEAVVVLFAV